MDEGSLSDTQRTMVLPLLQETNIHGKPYVTVSAKGISNGLSRYPNDGADFGPDTTLGATAPGQYGSPYTETVGINESITYAKSLFTSVETMPEISLGYGIFNLAYGVNLPSFIRISGHGIKNTYLDCYASVFTISDGTVAIRLSDMTIQSSVEPAGNFAQTEASTSFILENLSFITDENYNALIMDGNEDAYLNNIFTSNNDASGSSVPSFSFKIPYGGAIISKLSTVNGAIIQALTMSIIYRTISGTLSLLNNPNYPSSYVLLSGNDEPSSVTSPVVSSAIALVQSGSSTQPVNISIGGYAGSLGSTITEVINNPGTFPVQIDFRGYWVDNGQTGSIPLINNYSNVTLRNISSLYLTNTTIPSVAISPNPPVSGTAYQNTNPYDIEIDLPVYATTAGTAGYVTVAKGSTSTPTAIGNQYVSGSTSSTSTDIIKLRVPAGWYYELTASGVTFGTASVFAD
jgi:hypothetical protein